MMERYQIVEKLGEGRTSVVYRAEDTHLSRPVAIKFPKRGLLDQSPHYRAVFRREAEHLASLEHRAILPLYDLCESERGPALVLRYVESNLHVLANAAFDRRVFPAGQIILQVASALDHCAERAIAHRDVKPNNILVSADGYAYLTDFGLAAQLDDTESWTQPVGAKAYLSPELLIRGAADHADARRMCDQFSLGVSAYQTLTGELPHGRSEIAAPCSPEWEDCTALRLVYGQKPTPCCERVPGIPSQVDHVLERMLSVNPASRYPSNAAAAEDLVKALAGQGASDLHLFVSFAHQDEECVGRLVSAVEEKGLRIWWARMLRHGPAWDDQVREAMQECDVMLVVMTEHSATSPEVKNEWRYWMDQLEKPVLTLVSRGCERNIPLRLSSKQHLYAEGNALEAVAEKVVVAAEKVSQLWQLQGSRGKPPEEEGELPALADYVADGFQLRSADFGEIPVPDVYARYIPSDYRLVTPGLDLQSLLAKLKKPY